ncbi:sporulation-delaying protein SdpB family protein [Streptomyces pratensis]|uniref:sporulation-delaying protein SdpB family protein n=1 Tax=Streptomyces pratensis TaxID=1169025 RepID=UPI001932B555|nr:sporulation-delaying protein SdpB family protein [Streptomyces pratensis]
MLTALGTWATRVCGTSPFTDVYGAARTLLATGTLVTLVCNPASTLFAPGTAGAPQPHCGGAASLSVYCLAPGPESARWISVAVLLVVMSGFAPRWTAIPHWWVSYSLQVSASVIDGGDQISAVATLLLVPVALCDGRRSHWARDPAAPAPGERLRHAWIAGWIALGAVRLQAAVVYFHAGTAKFGVAEWADGTAMYYWLSDPHMGAPAWQRTLIDPLMQHSLPVALLTWSVPLGEIALAAALVMPARHWRPFLVAALLFHAAIAAVMGLVSFSLAMAALDLLFLRRADHALPLHLGVPARLRSRGRPAADTSDHGPPRPGPQKGTPHDDDLPAQDTFPAPGPQPAGERLLGRLTHLRGQLGRRLAHRPYLRRS